VWRELRAVVDIVGIALKNAILGLPQRITIEIFRKGGKKDMKQLQQLIDRFILNIQHHRNCGTWLYQLCCKKDRNKRRKLPRHVPIKHQSDSRRWMNQVKWTKSGYGIMIRASVVSY